MRRTIVVVGVTLAALALLLRALSDRAAVSPVSAPVGDVQMRSEAVPIGAVT